MYIYIYIYIFIHRTNEQMKLTQVSNYWFHVHTFIRIKICEMLNANSLNILSLQINDFIA